ncbi:MAG: Mor transcription activator family protein [Methylobacter sp.]|nr:Mor transcription activator family protein [Methylobacter sp.]
MLPENYPEKLIEMHQLLCVELAKLAQPDVAGIAFCVTETIRAHYSGTPLYFPKGEAYLQHQRNLEIFQKFDGSNHDALHREYGLTTKEIYRIVKRMYASELAKRQMRLFD